MSTLQNIQKDMQMQKIDFYIIPTGDYHQSEYVAKYFTLREFVSGFTGSAGTLVIEQDRAGLWTDSRYFLQAQKQLPDEITLHKMTTDEDSSYISYISRRIKPKSKISFNGKCVSTSEGRRLLDIAKKNDSVLEPDCTIAEGYWLDRPGMPQAKPYVLSKDITGESTKSKLDFLGAVLKEKKCNYFLVTKLDDIAYLLNMRGSDVEYNPVFYAFMVVKNENLVTEATLYIDSQKLEEHTAQYLKNNDITVKPYQGIYDDVANIKNSTVLIDEFYTNFALFTNLTKAGLVVSSTSPVTLKKAVKNEVELKLMQHYHRVDAVAMIKLIYYLKTNIGKEPMSEISVAQKLEEFRRENENFVDLSFSTIAGYKDHAAIVHYSANEQSSYTLEESGMLLLDSGAQYLGATTDITRTIRLGDVTDEEKTDFTTVLKAHLSLGNAIFLEGTNGMQLDIFAKSKMWQRHLNFGHGTGHGVGAFLNVHEGPHNISSVYKKIPFLPGMVVSNEPGVYKEGRHGIRIENLVYVVEDQSNEFGQFFTFNDLTLVPIDLDLIDKSMLTTEEKNQLNRYHKRVYEEIAPLLDEELKIFLKNATKELD